MTVGVFCGKIQSGFPNPKKDFAFVWANPETDHEPLKSTLWVDSSDGQAWNWPSQDASTDRQVWTTGLLIQKPSFITTRLNKDRCLN